MINYRSSIELNSNTLLNKEETKKVNQLLQGLFDNSESIDFRNPVPWKELNLLDYPSIIPHPMDLGTVKNKLQIGKYSTVEECLDDIQLIWDNCKSYNLKGTWIYNLADKLEKNFKKMIKNYLSFIASSAKKDKKEREMKKKEEKKNEIPKPPKPTEVELPPMVTEELPPLTLQEETIFIPRREFLYRAAHCTIDQMGILFLLIKNNAPESFRIVEGKVYIESEKIDDNLLKRLHGQLDMWGVGLVPAAGNKKK